VLCHKARWARPTTVEVLFVSDKLKRVMSTQRVLQKEWGHEGAKKITLRLQQLEAAPALAEMRHLPGDCHELTGDRAGHLAVDVHKGFRLIFHPTADPAPRKSDGGLDWTQVDSVTVTEVVDYH
jgi:proteic killer suppression protein